MHFTECTWFILHKHWYVSFGYKYKMPWMSHSLYFMHNQLKMWCVFHNFEVWLCNSEYALCMCEIHLTHCGLVMPNGNIDLGQHWFRYRLVAWWHQVITSANFDSLSVCSGDIHLREISEEISQPSITKFRLKITYLKCHSTLPGLISYKVFSFPCCSWLPIDYVI